MSDVQKADICVIGGGAAGVALASGAVQLGAKVILIERGQLGGENLHRGAVPLKALTAAANRAQSARDTRPFGITPMTPAVNFRQLAEHVQGTIAAVAPNASAERLAAFGIEVLRGSARFTAKDRVAVDTREIAARNFVIATGSTVELPAIAGLDKITHFTMGSFFSNIARFDHLVILGEGPHALEIGQAMVRLGSRVTIIARGKLLPDLDPELAQPLLAALTSEGIASAEDVSCDKVEKSDTGSLKLTLSKDGATEVLEASHLLVMGTRKPNTDGLDLGVAGVEHDASGIKVTNRLRTSNAAVYAIGDVTSGDPSATRARHEATVLVRRLVLGAAVVTLPDAVPRIVGTSPGLAQIGLSEAKARESYRQGVRILRWPFSENDKALAERQTEGFVKVVAGPSGRILGATIFGDQACEMIQLFSLAVSSGLTVGAVAEAVAAYPTYAETALRAAQGYSLEKPPKEGLAGALRLLPVRG